jgi:flavin-dependent dehydrogenase
LKQIVIIGGGLAGLVNAILLSRKGLNVRLYEKKVFPFHKVCGEYISNEVLGFLKREALLPTAPAFPQVNKFQLSSTKGNIIETPLDLGGFGISRYYLDDFLKQKAIEAGACIEEGIAVSNVSFKGGIFNYSISTGEEHQAQLIIGAYGKKSRIDNQLKRSFTSKTSSFIGVKYHIRTTAPLDTVSLHNFPKGYCGLSPIEDGKFNLCYLGNSELLKQSRSLVAYEDEYVKQNPLLKDLFNRSDFLFEKPEVINAFSFNPKQPVENHILMSGDAAGLITPLCGNGMALAIHSAYLLSEIIIKNVENDCFNNSQIEQEYTQTWKKHFQKRLWYGRKVQSLFGSEFTSEIAVQLIKSFPKFGDLLIRFSHGNPI